MDPRALVAVEVPEVRLMLEHVPAWLGRLLADRRAGSDKLLAARPGLIARFGGLSLTSPAFADGARLPERFTDDGDGVSPPLTWTGAPADALLALVVEDADAPTARPLVHLVIWGLTGESGRLQEGAANRRGGDHGRLGRNSFRRIGWLPPDPPTGHGEHRYAFQLFAVDTNAPDPGRRPGRTAVVGAITGRVVASDVLVGTYSRDEPAMIGAVGMVAPA